MRLLFAVMLLALPCASQMWQNLPGFPLVDPTPGNGYPLRVASPCKTSPEGSIQSWATPIVVYDDTTLALFVDESCLKFSVPSFGQNGIYMVSLISYYKTSESACELAFSKEAVSKLSPDSQREYRQECKLVGYKVRWIDVDTRAKKWKCTQLIYVDTTGLSMPINVKVPNEWVPLPDIEKEPSSRQLLKAIQRTTELIEKESADWNYRYKQH